MTQRCTATPNRVRYRVVYDDPLHAFVPLIQYRTLNFARANVTFGQSSKSANAGVATSYHRHTKATSDAAEAVTETGGEITRAPRAERYRPCSSLRASSMMSSPATGEPPPQSSIISHLTISPLPIIKKSLQEVPNPTPHSKKNYSKSRTTYCTTTSI